MLGNVRNVYRGKVLKLNIESVRLPNGTVVELEIAHHPGGAVVAAVDAEDRVCLLRQFRHAAGGWITELRPARSTTGSRRWNAPGANWPKKRASRPGTGSTWASSSVPRAS
jgi:ADP-ribose pyrophosphatase